MCVRFSFTLILAFFVFVFLFATASVLHALDPPTRVFLAYQESVTVSDRTGSNCGECTWSIEAEGVEVSTLPVFTLTVPSIDFGNASGNFRTPSDPLSDHFASLVKTTG